uniref:putative group II intron reverse transcriptase/maturase mat2 n=1 Tax=Strombomonas costata TaxID=161230 RepID=UPI0023AAB746|nr:putative group II intron reverse transcriptase/maturase mat2 [Strombomonas costata]WCH63642.1 putative group II intron reverse transcriptase/maturase mat2 [Strombomonas costata]
MRQKEKEKRKINFNGDNIMLRLRITNAKRRKARIKRDKKIRKRLYSNKTIENKKKSLKQKREIFKIPNGEKITWLRQRIIRMQSDLAVVIRERETAQVTRLVKYIIRNKLTQYWAVYKTVSSIGSRFQRILDNVKPKTQREYDFLRKQLWQAIKNPKIYKASPLKRIWIPKNKRDKFRPISKPSYLDKALQYLYLIILDVFQEEFADKDNYGFRPFRSAGWAAKAVTLAVWSRKDFNPPKLAIELDIRKCFDSINQVFILNEVAKVNIADKRYKKKHNLSENDKLTEYIEVIPKEIIEKWLFCGYLDIAGIIRSTENIIIPTQQGIIQGCPISLTIANMVLNGIQEVIEQNREKENWINSKEFKNTIWIKPDDIVSWRYNGKEVLRSTGLNKNNYNTVSEQLRKLGYQDIPKSFTKNFLTYKWQNSRGPWSYKILNVDSMMSKRNKIIDNAWIRAFRFVDDCLILLNDVNMIGKVINNIKDFLSPRGLELNMNKTHICQLHRGEKFQFVGFEFAMMKNHNKWKIYNYPPASQISNVKKKINLLFNKYKLQPYAAYYTVNVVIRGWCAFYASGNSSNSFNNLTHWLWIRTFRYWWEFLKYKKKYRIKSQRQNKKLLAYDVVKTYQKRLRKPLKNKNRANEILYSKVRWWIVPKEYIHNERWIDQDQTFYLEYPRGYKISTPSIISGKNAYLKRDRLELADKAIYWKSGLIQNLIIKSKGCCKLCGCSLLTGSEVNIEIHNIQPIEYAGKRKFTNIAALCDECQQLVTTAIKNKNLELIYILEARKILSNVSNLIAPKTL